VDDEPRILEILQAMLESCGHRVTTCLSGEQAVAVFQQDAFDLAVVDLGMRQMDGWEVSRRLNQIHPQIPIIMATGWNVSAADSQEQGAKVKAILKKPFGMEQLTRAVATALQD